MTHPSLAPGYFCFYYSCEQARKCILCPEQAQEKTGGKGRESATDYLRGRPHVAQGAPQKEIIADTKPRNVSEYRMLALFTDVPNTFILPQYQDESKSDDPSSEAARLHTRLFH